MAKDFASDRNYGFSRYIGPDDIDAFNAYRRGTGEELSLEHYDERDEDHIHWCIPFLNRAIVEIEEQYSIKPVIKFGISKSFYDSGAPRNNRTPRTIFYNTNYYIFIPGDMIKKLVIDINSLNFSNISKILGFDIDDTPPEGDILESFQGLTLFQILSGSIFRTNLANILIQLGLSFWIYHEMAHIKNGHLALSAARQSKGIPVTIMEKRVFEFDADAMAVNFLFKRCYSQIRIPFSIMQGPLDSGSHGHYDPFVLRTMQDAVNLTLFSCFTCFLTYKSIHSPNNVWEGAHPPLIFRLEYLALQMLAIVNNYPDSGIVDSEMTDTMQMILLDCYEQSSRISGESSVKDQLDMLKYFTPYNYEIRLSWNAILPELERYLLGGRLAPEKKFNNISDTEKNEIASARSNDWWPS